MERPGRASSRERVLSDDELAKVWRACEHLNQPGAVVRMLILTQTVMRTTLVHHARQEACRLTRLTPPSLRSQGLHVEKRGGSAC